MAVTLAGGSANRNDTPIRTLKEWSTRYPDSKYFLV